MTNTYLAMLEKAVLRAEQMIADREAAHRKGIYEPKVIFAAADAVRVHRLKKDAQNGKPIVLGDLVGMHVLDGVDFLNDTLHDTYRDSQVCRFRLDGKVYVAIEDPSDGYRSYMGSLLISDQPLANSFPSVEVLGVIQGDDIICFFDFHTAKPILSIGTDYTNSCYPSFVAYFRPENMAVNAAAPAPPEQEG